MAILAANDLVDDRFFIGNRFSDMAYSLNAAYYRVNYSKDPLSAPSAIELKPIVTED